MHSWTCGCSARADGDVLAVAPCGEHAAEFDEEPASRNSLRPKRALASLHFETRSPELAPVAGTRAGRGAARPTLKDLRAVAHDGRTVSLRAPRERASPRELVAERYEASPTYRAARPLCSFDRHKWPIRLEREPSVMRIVDMLARPRFFSFEFFPPKTEADEARLMDVLREQLEPLGPSFVSVTYGAGGSTHRTSVALAKRIKHEIGLEVLAHVTGSGRTRDEMRRLFDDLAAVGVENVLALRGDAPRNGEPSSTDSPFKNATDVIALLASEYDFCIGAACYPETHPEAISQAMDAAYAAEKVRLGAHFLITQLFFDNAAYFTFVQRARALGITVPIVPGIMPITNANQVRRFTSMCGATIPPELQAALDARADEPDAVPELGVAYASLQCADLLARGVPGLHFYTLNRSPATRAVVSALVASGLWPALQRDPVATP